MRLVTINTAKGDGRYAHRLEALAWQLGALRPDVVLLQEAFAACDGSIATAAYLGKALGLDVAYVPARRKERVADGRVLLSDSGLALLSRLPIAESKPLALPWDPADGERIAQLAVVEHPAGLIRLVNLHLTHLRHGASLRRAQINTVLRHPWLGQPAVARLLCGDFNAALESPELAGLLRGTFGWGVRDTYVAGGGGPFRATISPRAALHTASTPARCIDFIFSLDRPTEGHPSFSGSAVVLNTHEPTVGVLPSDHFGVMTTLSIEQERSA